MVGCGRVGAFLERGLHRFEKHIGRSPLDYKSEVEVTGESWGRRGGQVQKVLSSRERGSALGQVILYHPLMGGWK